MYIILLLFSGGRYFKNLPIDKLNYLIKIIFKHLPSEFISK